MDTKQPEIKRLQLLKALTDEQLDSKETYDMLEKEGYSDKSIKRMITHVKGKHYD